jgi:hypothetical protein
LVLKFLPKSHNYAKAFNNWERRSRYLLKEMVKYQIYIECLETSLHLQKGVLGDHKADQLVPPTKVLTIETVETTMDDEADTQHIDVCSGIKE